MRVTKSRSHEPSSDPTVSPSSSPPSSPSSATSPTSPDQALSIQQLLSPWPAVAGLALDAFLMLTALLLPILAFAGVKGGVREFVAVFVLAVAPGWGGLRAFGVPASTFTALAGTALSLGFTMLVGLIAVTRLDWQWRGSLILIEIVALAGLGASLVRHRNDARRTRAISDPTP